MLRSRIFGNLVFFTSLSRKSSRTAISSMQQTDFDKYQVGMFIWGESLFELFLIIRCLVSHRSVKFASKCSSY